MAIIAYFNLEAHQIDIVTAYLNSTIDHEIYIEQPYGHNDGTGRVCILRKALNGLK